MIVIFPHQQGVFNGGRGKAKGSNRGHWRTSQFSGRTSLPVSLLRIVWWKWQIERQRQWHRHNWQKTSQHSGRTPLLVSHLETIQWRWQRQRQSHTQRQASPVGELHYQWVFCKLSIDNYIQWQRQWHRQNWPREAAQWENSTTSESENFPFFHWPFFCFSGQPSWQGSPLKCNCAKRRSLAQLSPYRSSLKKRCFPQWHHLVTNSNSRGGGYSIFLNETILGSLVTLENSGGSGYCQRLQDRVSQLLLQWRRRSVLEGEHTSSFVYSSN